jgi:serine/threonine protein kinase
MTAETAFQTSPGTIMGTVAYMSPEQARGHEVDARTDLFSFGIVLYQMVTGRPPFHGADSASILASLLRDTPESPSALNTEVPPSLEEILSRLMEKDIDLRFSIGGGSPRRTKAAETWNKLKLSIVSNLHAYKYPCVNLSPPGRTPDPAK